MAAFQQRGEDLQTNFAECQRLLEETQTRLRYLKDGDADEEKEAELKKVQSEAEKLKQDEKSFQLLMEDHQREEKKLPWNVDTISKEGFSKVATVCA